MTQELRSKQAQIMEQKHQEAREVKRMMSEQRQIKAKIDQKEAESLVQKRTQRMQEREIGLHKAN